MNARISFNRTAAGFLLHLVAGLGLLPVARAADDKLLTVAETSGYQATSRHAEVVEFCERLAKGAPLVRLGELGVTSEGRKLPLVILADPPVATPQEAAQSKKLVVFALGDIHAGEVDGKEALLMLARDLATAKERPLLKDLVLVFAPIFNADGNDRIAKTNRSTQVGPAEGAGQRANAQGFDLNRDFVKLESPEVRALVRFLNHWNPALIIDTHTTNGSHHRYTITYDGPRNAAIDGKLVAFARDTLLPDAGRRLEQHGGYKSYFYGNFNREHTRWEMYPPEPRYGIQYFGFRNQIGILSESYSYAPYKDRVLASRDFVHSLLEFAAEHRKEIGKLVSEARDASTRAGKKPTDNDRVVLRQKEVAAPGKVDVLGFVEEEKDGRRVATDRPRDYPVEFISRSEPTLSVRRPVAYLFPAALANVVENLQRHGIEVEELREDIELKVEAYRLDKISRAEQAFQKHRLVTVEASPRPETRRVEAGSILVRTGQPLGMLAAYLLEPQAEDGLCTWNFFDDALKEGQDFPVLRLPAAVPLVTTRVRPLPEDRQKNKPLSREMVLNAGRRGDRTFNGSPVSGLIWLDDGEHFLQEKGDRLYKVHAVSGRLEPFHNPAQMAKALAALPTIEASTARSWAEDTSFHMNPQHTGALFAHEDDLYFAPFDGGKAVRLTKTPGRKEMASFSPDGQFVAFVRDQNLFVVDLKTQTERALTTDGGGLISNGKADWVYFEEIFNRRSRAYWWSPDSQAIAFLRFDDNPVHKFTVTDLIPTRQVLETTPYPKSGDPNPLVKLGTVSVAGGPVRWVDLGNYSETASLVPHAGWTQDGQTVYFYVQDRAQTWLDFCTVAADGGTPKRLFRETTKAWVNDPGEAKFLKDGSFLLFSERTGYKHLYHFDKEGKLLGPVTSGPWDVSELHLVDEAGGWVYFSGARDSFLASNLYRVRLDGSGLQHLTTTPGDHHVNMSPKGNLFVTSWSSATTPTKVQLLRTDGTPARMLDSNPVYALEEYRLSKPEFVHIKADDGFVLEGVLLKPPDLEPGRRYPVWFMTYGGPYAPTVRDTWAGGRILDQVLAQLGFIVFHADPRSASGKGVSSAWACYRRLGVQELKDIETAIRWLIATHPEVDSQRIGMSGTSYGGFMTAFALTHSKLFAAGIAGAPVTDWRDYDSIYTERYMNTPQENPDGYDKTSVVKAARNLHGRLLLVHGLMDDNVHLQNTMQLVQELQRADKDFELMIYPRARHGGFGRHYQRLSLEFMERTLRPGDHTTAAR